MVYMRGDVILELDEIDLLIDFIEAYPGLAAEAIESAYRTDIEPGLLAELTHYPGPAKTGLNSESPFRWSVDPDADERARRYVFANNLQGRPRTNKLADSYSVDIVINDSAVVIGVRNNAAHHQFVKGRRQIPGHERTGWERDKLIMDFWSEASREVIIDVVTGLVTGDYFFNRS